MAKTQTKAKPKPLPARRKTKKARKPKELEGPLTAKQLLYSSLRAEGYTIREAAIEVQILPTTAATWETSQIVQVEIRNQIDQMSDDLRRVNRIPTLRAGKALPTIPERQEYFAQVAEHPQIERQGGPRYGDRLKAMELMCRIDNAFGPQQIEMAVASRTQIESDLEVRIQTIAGNLQPVEPVKEIPIQRMPELPPSGVLGLLPPSEEVEGCRHPKKYVIQLDTGSTVCGVCNQTLTA